MSGGDPWGVGGEEGECWREGQGIFHCFFLFRIEIPHGVPFDSFSVVALKINQKTDQLSRMNVSQHGFA